MLLPFSILKSFWQEKNNTAVRINRAFLYNDLFVRVKYMIVRFK
jgi:hypothetical protein